MAYATRTAVGTKIKTRYSEGTVISMEWVNGRGTKRKMQYTVRWDNGAESKVSQKRLTLLTRGIPQPGEAGYEGSEQSQQSQTETPRIPQETMPKTETPRIPQPTLPGDVADSGLASILADAIGPYVKGKLDRDEVMSLIDERIHSFTLPRTVQVVTLEKIAKDVGVQHVHFDAVLRLLSAGIHVWLVGPAGSGKTSIAAAVADALELPHYSLSVCQLTSKADLLGYRNVSNGEYVRTDLREAFEHGGVFLLDEVDAGNPNVMVVMNALMANDYVSFPDGMVKRSPNFRLIAGANTIGMGANTQYVGRNKLDEATRDRFALMQFPYDPAIEAAMCGVSPSAFSESDRPKAFEFHAIADEENAERDADLKAQVELRCMDVCRQIVRVRKAIEATGIRHIVSPRASKTACTMLRVGFTIEDTMEMAVWKGLDADSIRKIKSHC